MHLTACHTASSNPDLISSAFSRRSLEDVSESDAAKVLNSSFFNLCANSQSITAEILDITSAHPEASILYGALIITDVSASIASGDTAVFETDPALCFNDARGDATPS